MKTFFDIKSFFVFLNRHKVYTFIDIAGLSVSLLFVIIIAIYTKQELSVDKFQKNADNIYVLSDGNKVTSAYKLGYRVQEQCPEIEKVCHISNAFGKHPVTVAEQKINAELLLADSTFFNMFSFDLLIGDRQTVLNTRQSAVISETFARKVFMDTDPIGKTIRLNDSLSVVVNGVMKDIRNSVITYGDIIARIENCGVLYPGMDSDWFMMSGLSSIFFMTYPDSDIHSKEEAMADYFKDIFWYYRNGHADKVMFVPFQDLYFSEYDGNLRKGDWLFVVILISIGVIILVFAIINYVNLTVAQTGFRAKEMATRRLMGSSRIDLFSRLIVEATLLTLFSYIIAVLLVFAAIPFANNLLNTTLYPDELLTLPGITVSVLVILIIGFITGLLPAIIISNAKPIDVVKGEFRHKNKMIFSKFFITFQQIITISLVAVALTMTLQINHLINAPLGYNTAHIIDVDTDYFDSAEQVFLFGDKVKQLAGVKQVGYGMATPFTGGFNSTWVCEGKNTSFQILSGDSTYFKIFGFEILRNNNLASGEGFFANQQVFRHLGIPEDTPTIKAEGREDFVLAGVMKDFKLWNITKGSSETVLFRFVNSRDNQPWDIIIDVQGEEEEVLTQVKSIYHEITGSEDFPGKYIETAIEESFATPRRTARIIQVFSFVALVISLLGLLAISTYFIQQRSREVAIRKVFGSTNKQVLQKLVYTFLNYVLIGFVIATPLIWYSMQRWLSAYEYRIHLHPWIFIVAGSFCLLISFVTVFWQSYFAANKNPAESIKAE